MDPPRDILQGCPFPDVAEALRPYIKTRQEVAIIRQGLQSRLPISSVNALNPQLPENFDSSKLSGVRKAYWRALQAHQAAQAKYEALKADIDQLSRGESTNTVANDSSAFLTESYVPLVRQREKQRKLKIIDNTLAKVESTGADLAGESFDKVARREAGELPPPPSNGGFTDLDMGSDADYDLTRLKKAVLSTRYQIDQHRGVIDQTNGVLDQEINPYADLRALQKAHGELTMWMEQQLGMISDVGATKEVNVAPKAENGEVEHFTMQDIETLYEQYLASRQRLLNMAANPPESELSATSSPDVVRRNSNAPDAEQSSGASEILLPYLPRLVAMRQAERDLLHSSSYTRRQLASAETQTHAVLTRLADESHLLQPDIHRGAPRGKDWKKAAAEASKATITTTSQRLASGKVFAESAENTLHAMEEMPASLDALL